MVKETVFFMLIDNSLLVVPGDSPWRCFYVDGFNTHCRQGVN